MLTKTHGGFMAILDHILYEVGHLVQKRFQYSERLDIIGQDHARIRITDRKTLQHILDGSKTKIYGGLFDNDVFMALGKTG